MIDRILKMQLLVKRFLVLVTAFIFNLFILIFLIFPKKGNSIFDPSILNIFGFGYIDNSLIINNFLLDLALLIYLVPLLKKQWLLLSNIIFCFYIAIIANKSNGLMPHYIAFNISVYFSFFLLSYLLIKKVKNYKLYYVVVLIITYCYYTLSIFVDILKNSADKRLMCIFDHPNHLANLLAFGVVFCFSGGVLAVNRKVKVFLWVICCVLLIGLVKTLCRGAWVGCFVGLVAACFYLKKEFNLKRAVVSVAVIVLALIISISIASPKQIKSRFAENSPDVIVSVGNRVLLWKTTLNMIKDNWLIGVGIGNFGNVLKKDYKTKFANNEPFDAR